MDVNECKKSLLRKMVNVKINDLNWKDFYPLRYLFFDFREMFDVSDDFYKDMLFEMNKEGLIKIEKNGFKELDRYSIFVTREGVEYLLNAKN